MEAGQRYRILVTSNEPWSDIWFSKQHYANELAKMGHEVYFINAPTHWSPKHLLSSKVRIKALDNQLHLIEYNNPLPLRGPKKQVLQWNDKIVEKRIYKALPASDLPILWWQFDPFRFAYLRRQFKNIPIHKLYHITDPFDHIFSDKLLAKQADLVVTVLKRYEDYYQQLNQKPVLYIPHGISEDEFKIDATVNKAYTKFKDSILKIGTINDHYNIQLLLDIAQHFTDRQLVVVGPNKLTIPEKQEQFKQLSQLPNVAIEGGQKATLLKYYVNNAAVCIVPYDFNIESIKGTPLKVLNYLAQEKVSITSIATGLDHLLGKGLVKSNETTHFIQSIQDAIDKNIVTDKAYLKDFFTSVSYPFLIQKILRELEQRK